MPKANFSYLELRLLNTLLLWIYIFNVFLIEMIEYKVLFK